MMVVLPLRYKQTWQHKKGSVKMANKICPNCGLENVAGRNICKRCHISLDTVAASDRPQPTIASSLLGGPYVGPQWEYLYADFIFTTRDGWFLIAIGGVETTTNPPITIAEFTRQAGQHGWELVSSLMSYGERPDSAFVAIGRSFAGKSDLSERITLMFKRPQM